MQLIIFQSFVLIWWIINFSANYMGWCMFCNDYKLHGVFLCAFARLLGSFHSVVSNYIDDTLWFDIICIIFHGCDSFISFRMFDLSLQSHVLKSSVKLRCLYECFMLKKWGCVKDKTIFNLEKLCEFDKLKK